MVTSVNGGLCDGNLEKRLLDNGYQPSGSDPKYKIRKVSAVRDFPPHCGPNACPLNSNMQENVVVPIGGIMGKEVEGAEENSVNQTEAQPLEAVKSPSNEKASESLDVLVENIVAASSDGLLNGGDEMIIDVQPLESAWPNGAINNVVAVLKEVNADEAQPITAENNELDSFPFIHRKGEDKRPASISGVSANPPVLVDSLESWLPSKSSVSESIIKFKERNSPTPKDKFRIRRVSAIRDFPPFCGPHAPRNFEHEPQLVNSEAMSLIKVPDVKSKCEAVDGLAEGSPPVDEVNGTCEAPPMVNIEGCQLTGTVIDGNEKLWGVLNDNEFEKGDLIESGSEAREQPETLGSNSVVENCEISGKEIVLPSQENSDISWPSEKELDPGEVAREVVHGLMAEPYCPWRSGKSALSLSEARKGKVQKDDVVWHRRSKATAKKSVPVVGSPNKKKLYTLYETSDDSSSAMMIKGGGVSPISVEPLDTYPSPLTPVRGKGNYDFALPPFGPNTSNLSDARNRVRETLRLFQGICRKILQGEENKSGPAENGMPMQTGKPTRRIDLAAAKIIKERGKEVNTGMQHIGEVPGVEVGDEFQYRVELAIVGIHRLYQAGIDFVKKDGMLLATSIVASGAYADEMDDSDVLVYSGQGGNVVGKKKQPEDQKLEKGNLALKNSVAEKNPVRVIRGTKEMRPSDTADGKDKLVTTYVYAGLYVVDRYWTETGAHGKMVFMFELRRLPGQPELAWKEVKLSKKHKKRQGVCVDDISGGKEPFPICAINTIDSEKPPPFTYITKMMYPDWFRPVPPKGCFCTGRCSDSRKCSCAVKNGGEIPYNHNGAIVEVKPLVYECGPACKCPLSCYNRVSQRGMKIKLEIFKTKTRGWGVRSLSFIPSGSFICEYVGELLEDKEAEKRTGSDEYLFDIGRNYTDNSSKPSGVDRIDVNEDGYTIDAFKFGNVGRFINHSCSPNLYAQNVVYDHDDTRMPHVMLFAAENIPALQELSYHYNYSVDDVRDSNGNIKKKSCYCGSAECTGRLY